MADYDAIVVGAGLAGSTAAYCMAKAGLSVLVIERGDTAGSKNVTGGRMYGHALEKIIPGFADEAPVERKVVRERIGMMTPDSCFTVDFHSNTRFSDPSCASYVVHRAEFDAWLSSKAEEEGVDVVCPAVADDLIMEDGKVIGVRAGEDELTSDVVILAEGVNGLLAQKLGMKHELSPHHVAVGCKEIVELGKDVINDRFNLNDGEGMAMLAAGCPSNGQVGGGFMYTGKDSVCVGLMMTIAGLPKSDIRMPDLMENFRNHPSIAPFLAGGKIVEYSAHLAPEGGLGMVPNLTRDNVIICGDAAGFCLNLGFTVRGMDLAIASGEMAAQTVIEAKEKGDFSDATLSSYKKKLENSFVMKDLKTYKHAPNFIDHTPNLFNGRYTDFLADTMTQMFTVSGTSKLMLKKTLPLVWKAGPFSLLKDALRAGRSI